MKAPGDIPGAFSLSANGLGAAGPAALLRPALRRYRPAMADMPQAQAALPTAADIDAAAGRLAGVALRTPLISSPVLDAAIGARVFLKAETLQRTGSFK